MTVQGMHNVKVTEYVDFDTMLDAITRRMDVDGRLCHRCSQIKPLTDYTPKATKSGGVTYGWCNECHREYSREYNAMKRRLPDYKEKRKAEKAKMRTTESGREFLRRCKSAERKRRKCLERGLPADFGVRAWRTAKSDWGDHCAYCGKECELTQDHYVPVSNKACPGHVAHNIVPACIECNMAKSNKPSRAWIGNDSKADSIEDWLRLQIPHDMPLVFC